MSYTKHNFASGEIIYAADLNEMDDQIAANEEASTVDATLSQEGKPADAKAVGDEITDLKADLKNTLIDYNAYDLLEKNRNNKTANGITWSWNNDGSCTVSGTKTGAGYYLLEGRDSSPFDVMPSWMIPGNTYYVKYNSEEIPLHYKAFKSGGSISGAEIFIRKDTAITVPTDADGVYLRLEVSVSTAVNTTVKPIILSAPSNADLKAESNNKVDKIPGKNLSTNDYSDDDKAKVLSNASSIEDIKSIIGEGYSTDDLFANALTKVDETYRGVTFAWSGNTCTISGTSTGNIQRVIAGNNNVMPAGMVAGGEYYVETNNSNTIDHLIALVFNYYENETYKSNQIFWNGSGDVVVPAGTTGIRVRFETTSGMTMNLTMTPKLYNNEPRTDSLDERLTKLESMPEVILKATNNTLDRANEINTLLNSGYCKLGPGDFYVSGIVMPRNSKLSGCGAKTRIILLDSITSGAAIKMKSYCQISDLLIGTDDSYVPSDTPSERVGILRENDGDSHYTFGKVSNASIVGISKAIKIKDTVTANNTGLLVDNVSIYKCDIGLEITKCEYNRFENMIISGCYYGALNDAGNNLFNNCTFVRCNEAFVMSNENVTNTGHGSAVGCQFNHSGNNDGVAVKAVDMENGFIFSGCQFFASYIDITNSDGIAFDGCNFGESYEINATATDGDNHLTLFNGCVFGSTPIFANNDTSGNAVIKVNSCYLRNGTEVLQPV